MTGTPSEEARLAEQLTLAPPGDAYPRRRESVWARVQAPIAAELVRIEGQADSMVLEVAPGSAPHMLDGYEAVLGDDPCLGAVAALPTEIRYALAEQRWTRQGITRPQEFVELAAAVGVAVTVEESTPLETGIGGMGDEIVLEEGRFEWLVHLPTTEAQPSPVECLFRQRKPAHTEVYFFYDLEP